MQKYTRRARLEPSGAHEAVEGRTGHSRVGGLTIRPRPRCAIAALGIMLAWRIGRRPAAGVGPLVAGRRGAPGGCLALVAAQPGRLKRRERRLADRSPIAPAMHPGVDRLDRGDRGDVAPAGVLQPNRLNRVRAHGHRDPVLVLVPRTDPAHPGVDRRPALDEATREPILFPYFRRRPLLAEIPVVAEGGIRLGGLVGMAQPGMLGLGACVGGGGRRRRGPAAA